MTHQKQISGKNYIGIKVTERDTWGKGAFYKFEGYVKKEFIPDSVSWYDQENKIIYIQEWLYKKNFTYTEL